MYTYMYISYAYMCLCIRITPSGDPIPVLYDLKIFPLKQSLHLVRANATLVGASFLGWLWRFLLRATGGGSDCSDEP